MSERFDFTTPAYRLRAEGIAIPVVPEAWNGTAVADAVDAVLLRAEEHSGDEQPIVVGAIPFDPSTPARLFVPRTVQCSEGTATTPELADAPDEHLLFSDDSPGYRQEVAGVIEHIRSGDVEKVVLARSLRADAAVPIDPDVLFQRLAARNPSAYTYRLDLAAEPDGVPPVLIGASPELVLAIDAHGRVESHPLAGSAPRAQSGARPGSGDSASDSDAAVAATLLASPKDLAEHAFVTRSVGAAFRELADDVRVPDMPGLVATADLWHLGTRITGRLRPWVRPLDLAYRMHPTPAVSGYPVDAARSIIADLEDVDRGFFAGLVGWVGADGSGEWALALRGGIVHDRTARLFAGAGIVAGSDPDAEHRETGVKLATFAKAMHAGDVDVRETVQR